MDTMRCRGAFAWRCLRLAGLLLLSAPAWAATAVDLGCPPVGRLEFGPYDYRAAPPEYLKRVENFHFNADVETLRKGQSSVNIGEDLEFVLRYFPNHSRALSSLVQLAKRENTNKPRGSHDTVDCWFERASAFVPDDGAVHLLYAIWLVQRGDKPGATRELASAASSGRGDANFVYNLGLVYLDVGDFDSSLAAAHRAYAMGYPLPGLRDRLKRAGKWRPPPEGAAGDNSTPAGAAAPPAK